MGLNARQFLNEIIEPTLDCMGRIIDKRMALPEAKMLLLGTASAESQLTYITQLNNGPAVGLYQMEHATFADIVEYCDRKGRDFRNKVIYCIHQKMYEEMPHGSQLINNLRLQTVFTRLHYWRVEEPIPTATPLQARYWKKYYNTEQGRGTVQHYLNAFPSLL